MKKLILIIILAILSSKNCFAQLEFSEIHPNPEGKDAGNEWIEIYNSSSTKIDLSGWTLENNNKQDSLNGSIMPQTLKVIPLKNLKNSENTLKLISPQNQVIQKISYQEAPSGQSWTKISPTNWQWTAPTKNTKNPKFVQFTGTISQPPTISNEFYFTLKTKEDRSIKILFNSADFNFQKLQASLTPETPISLTAEEKAHNYWLISYQGPSPIHKLKKITQYPAGPKPKGHYYLYIVVALLFCILIKLYNNSL